MKWPLTKLVEVEWTDSCTEGGWNSHSAYLDRAQPTICRSIGYLLVKTKEKVVVVQTMSLSTGHVSDSMAIPIVAVRKIRFLKGGL